MPNTHNVLSINHTVLRSGNPNLGNTKAPLNSQVQGTGLFMSAASGQRSCPKIPNEEHGPTTRRIERKQ